MRRNLAILSTLLATLLAVVCGAAAQSPEGEGSRRAIPPPHDPSHAATAATWCGLHLGRREFDQALSDCDYAVATQPGNPGAFSNRGSVYLVLGLFSKALPDFDAALRLNPSDASLYFNRGIAYAGLKNRDAAIADYTASIKLNPKFAAAYHNRGYEYEQDGKKDLAISDYRKSLEIDPSLGPPKLALKRLGGGI